jgi:hypothetical protein
MRENSIPGKEAEKTSWAKRGAGDKVTLERIV